ncbi:MAG: SDR family NAD(P)-dependent oxidoreductase [Gordonia sp. (in: high G+C Gram-positive bacteria)]|uniref:SDR family NAD(P)-dependent oxidoreductase n=1 Tax=Gordonia sp. (in: high G+C Gram-positive bacteria) TaxID=84139 RepID=UPI003BB71407
MRVDVYGKVFVVTGAGNGIGRRVALELLRRGGRVAAADLDQTGLADMAQEAGAGDRLTLHLLNVADTEAVALLPGQVLAAHGHVDGLFNIAGIAQNFEPAGGIERARLRQIVDINFYGTVDLTRAFLPLLQERPAGGVVMLTASLAAMVPVPGAAIYGASKAAVAQFGYGLAQDLRNAKSKVTVTTVLPGTIWTDLVRASAVTLGTPEAVAKAFAMPADKAAHRMIEATLRGRRRAVIGKDAHVYDFLGRISPALAERVSYLQVASFVYRERR